MHKVKWLDRYKEPQVAPNPQFPNGVDLDLSVGAEKSCLVALPYPARRCGYYSIICDTCGLSALVTTAGRPDDPRSVKLPCKNYVSNPFVQNSDEGLN